jgi:hypothetical protein
MAYRKNNITTSFVAAWNERDIDYHLYQEMSPLFEAYVTVKYSVNLQPLLQLPSLARIKDIGRLFCEQVETEGLLRVYPLAIKTHLLYYLINDLHLQADALALLTEVYTGQVIQQHEWLNSTWTEITSLYRACCAQTNAYMITDEVASVDAVIARLKNHTRQPTALQMLWCKMFLEEVHGERFIN